MHCIVFILKKHNVIFTVLSFLGILQKIKLYSDMHVCYIVRLYFLDVASHPFLSTLCICLFPLTVVGCNLYTRPSRCTDP